MQSKGKLDDLKTEFCKEDIDTCDPECDIPNKKMVRQKLVRPRKTVEAKHKCSYCSYSSVDARNLRRHLVTHTGERPHECPECQKAFTLKHHLRDHMRIHTGEKPFKCENCGQAFSRKTHLQRHEVIHSGNAPYVCNTCGQEFRRKPSLKVHERTHMPASANAVKKQVKEKINATAKTNISQTFAEPYNNIQV